MIRYDELLTTVVVVVMMIVNFTMRMCEGVTRLASPNLKISGFKITTHRTLLAMLARDGHVVDDLHVFRTLHCAHVLI